LLKNDKEIHQTKMIFNLMKMCNISFDSNTNINISLPKNKLNITSANKSLVTIHLSNKWINKHYSEENFFDLIAKLPTKKYTYVLTTDDYTNHKFRKIYKRFQIISNNNLHKINLLDRNFTIFDKPNFENWKQIIYSSNLIITPECGCSHMASACRIPVIIIYDAENYPEAIYKEYHPWKSKHEKLVFNYESLNEKIVNNLT